MLKLGVNEQITVRDINWLTYEEGRVLAGSFCILFSEQNRSLGSFAGQGTDICLDRAQVLKGSYQTQWFVLKRLEIPREKISQSKTP